ncbi:TolC family protein [soil metagenome]
MKPEFGSVRKLLMFVLFSFNRLKTAAFAAFAVIFGLILFSEIGLAQTPTPDPLPTVTPVPMPSPNDPMPAAPSFSKPTAPLPSLDRVGVDIGNQLSLTLDQAIEMALKNNNDIDVSRNDTKIADFNFKAANGVYDPLLNSQGYFESRTTPTASTIGGAVNGSVTQRQFFSDFGISGIVPKFGGSYDVIFNSSRTTSTNRNSTLNPQFPTSLVVTFTQPLWRGRNIDQNRRTILIAKKNIDLSDSQLREKAMDTVTTVQQAYWDLTYALRNLQVQMDALKQAKEQLESNQRLVAKGILAPIEIVAATAQISRFEQGVFAAQETITRTENTLKTLLLPDKTSAEWSRPITPVSPIAQTVPRIGLEIAMTEALKNRPEIEQIGVNTEINEINKKFYKNQLKPQLDLVSSYTAAGLAGTPNPLSAGAANVPANLVGGYFGSITNLLQQDYPTYRIGVQLALPLRNTVAKANLGRTLVEGDRIQNQREQTEQTITAEVRNSLQALRSAESVLTSATTTREAAEELYNSEERQFRSGTTTFYLVSQRQTDLLAAKATELQAQTNLNKIISIFQRAIGNTLTVNNVTVTK